MDRVPLPERCLHIDRREAEFSHPGCESERWRSIQFSRVKVSCGVVQRLGSAASPEKARGLWSAGSLFSFFVWLLLLLPARGQLMAVLLPGRSQSVLARGRQGA